MNILIWFQLFLAFDTCYAAKSQVANPLLHQFLYALLSQLRQRSHNDQLQNGIRQMLVHVLVAPDIQLPFQLLNPLLLVISAEESATHSGVQQRKY